MELFNKLSIRNKLVVGFCLLLVCIAVVVFSAVSAISSIIETQETLFQVEFPLTVGLVKLRATINRESLILTKALTAKSGSEMSAAHNELNEVDHQVDEHMLEITDLASKVPEAEAKMRQLISIRNDYEKTRDNQIWPLVIAEKVAEAQDLTSSVQSPRYETMRQIALDLSRISEQNDKLLMVKTTKTARDSFIIFAIASIIALGLVFIISVLMVTTVAHPINRLSVLVEKIAYGDLTVEVPSQPGTDEVRTLQFMVGMMVASLRQITTEIREVVGLLTNYVDLADENLDKATNSESKMAETTRLKELAERLQRLIGEYKL